MFVKRILFQHS